MEVTLTCFVSTIRFSVTVKRRGCRPFCFLRSRVFDPFYIQSYKYPLPPTQLTISHNFKLEDHNRKVNVRKWYECAGGGGGAHQLWKLRQRRRDGAGNWVLNWVSFRIGFDILFEWEVKLLTQLDECFAHPTAIIWRC